MSKITWLPEGYRTVTPHLVVRDAAAALEFYGRALGAQELFRMPGPDGRIMHAEMKIGDSIVMMGEEMPKMGAHSPQALGGSPVTLMLYLPDVDAAFQRAVQAGCTAQMPPADMFWGDRYGKLTDPFGHNWALATHVEDVPPEEMEKRMAAMFASS